MIDASFRYLFEKDPDPMWILDRETLRFLEVNETAVAHYGYPREAFLQMSVADIRPPDEVSGQQEAVAPGKGGSRHSCVMRHRTEQGRIIDVDVTSYAIEFAGRPRSSSPAISPSRSRRSRCSPGRTVSLKWSHRARRWPIRSRP